MIASLVLAAISLAGLAALAFLAAIGHLYRRLEAAELILAGLQGHRLRMDYNVEQLDRAIGPTWQGRIIRPHNEPPPPPPHIRR